MYIPYTYLIGWSKLDKWYYGVRWVEGCHPNDLWKEYFTSSEYVKMMKDVFGDPDIIEVRKKFDCPKKARLWETLVISRMRMFESQKWLNRSNPLKTKISIDMLKEYRNRGETYESIAKRFGVSRQAVHSRLKSHLT